jgi:hypothetical protein
LRSLQHNQEEKVSVIAQLRPLLVAPCPSGWPDLEKPAIKKLVSSENLQSLLLTCLEPVSPVKKLSHHALPEALYELVVSPSSLSRSYGGREIYSKQSYE